MLVDEGQIAWDAPVRTYLPAFVLSDESISNRVTVRDLLTHRSGLPRHDLLWYNNNESSRSELIGRLRHLELTADLRERFQYNNLLYMTAGYLAGVVAGSSWEDVVRERLFTPLAMTRSNFSVLASQEDPDHALPYREEEGIRREIPFRRIDLIGPAGSINSSINEMARWLLFNLAEGKVNGRRLINVTTLNAIHTPQITTGVPSSREHMVSLGYAMGWSIAIYRGHRLVTHGGGIDGFATSVMLFPEDDLALVAFANMRTGVEALLNQHAADRILGLEPKPWLDEALERRTKGMAVAEAARGRRDRTRIKGTRPSHPLDAYVGTYQHPGYGTLTVAWAPGRRALSATFNGITFPLRHWHYDVWQGGDAGDGSPTFKNTQLLFRTDFTGEISAVEAPFEQNASPVVFEKQPDPRLSDPAFLARYVATYVSPVSGKEERIELRGNRLTLSIPGQRTYTLVPTTSGRFEIEGLEGYEVGFGEDFGGAVSKIVYHQPDGVFESMRADAAAEAGTEADRVERTSASP